MKKEIDYYDLFENTINNHPNFKVIPYFVKNEINLKRFASIKRKKWSEEYFTVRGEWSQTWMHQGNLTFQVKFTSDKRYWALFRLGFPTRIYAVAEILSEGEMVLELVTAFMLNVFTKYENLYIDDPDIFDEDKFNRNLFLELSEYFEEYNIIEN